MRVHIDSFEAVELPKQKRRMTYAEFRAAALKAGRFSVFEATASDWSAGMFTALCRDVTVETDTSCGFPWTLVRERVAQGADR